MSNYIFLAMVIIFSIFGWVATNLFFWVMFPPLFAGFLIFVLNVMIVTIISSVDIDIDWN